tara:strand:+ start:584 stop:1840 length:1257 start_codon:yes stop_codon:yes gene_type:complete
MNVSSILDQISSTRGTIAKTDILKSHADNDILKTALKMGLDNFIPFNVVKVPKVKTRLEYPLSEDAGWKEFFAVLGECATRSVTGNAAIDRVLTCFSSVRPEDEFWMRKILKKKLSIGASTKTVNKVFPGLIPTFEVALAQQFELKRIKDMESVYVEPKLDGIRCFAIVEDGEAKMFARSGKLISNFDSTIGASLGELGDGCYDGELMGEDFVALMRQAYRKENIEIGDAYLTLFDYLPLDEWRSGEVDHTTKERYIELKRKVASLNLRELVTKPDEPLYLNVVPRHEVPAKLEDIMALHHTFVQEGYEGAMVKTIDAPYRFGRSYDVMKVKEFHDVDLPIIGLEEGTGRHAGRLGAVKIDFNGVIVKVGSGFSDEQREQVWNDQPGSMGRIIEVRYQEVTPDGSLRFPTFVCFRNDR